LQETVAAAINRATLEVFALIVGVDVVAEPHGQSMWPALETNIISSFRLSGSIAGMAQVCYTLPLANRITCQMLQIEPPAGEPDVLDAAGEVANMIVGNVKNSLESRWGPIRIGTPAVEFKDDSGEKPQAMRMNFRCCGDIFAVSVAFQEDILC